MNLLEHGEGCFQLSFASAGFSGQRPPQVSSQWPSKGFYSPGLEGIVKVYINLDDVGTTKRQLVLGYRCSGEPLGFAVSSANMFDFLQAVLSKKTNQGNSEFRFLQGLKDTLTPGDLCRPQQPAKKVQLLVGGPSCRQSQSEVIWGFGRHLGFGAPFIQKRLS